MDKRNKPEMDEQISNQSKRPKTLLNLPAVNFAANILANNHRIQNSPIQTAQGLLNKQFRIINKIHPNQVKINKLIFIYKVKFNFFK